MLGVEVRLWVIWEGDVLRREREVRGGRGRVMPVLVLLKEWFDNADDARTAGFVVGC